MNTEIELKFIVSPAIEAPLLQLVKKHAVSKHHQQQLTNTYYDTPTQLLRSAKMGLRVRTADNVHTQTLKTEGRVVAGLHQRPEFNVAIMQDVPDLTLFDVGIWPAKWDVSAVNAQLQPLFNTDFLRQQWLIYCEDLDENGKPCNQFSEIELAFDQGWVIAGEHREAICEIELELVSGQPRALFQLATELCQLGGLRQGSESKAARGYRLAQQVALSYTGTLARHTADIAAPLSLMAISRKANLEHAFAQALEQALAHWQTNEARFHTALCSTTGIEPAYHAPLAWSALQEVRCAVDFIRHWFTLFGRHIPRKATATLRHELLWLDEQLGVIEALSPLAVWLQQPDLALHINAPALFDAVEKALHPLSVTHYQALLFSPRYAQLVLMFNQWLIEQRWQGFIDTKSRQDLAAPIKRFADIQLARQWSEVKSVLVGAKPLARQNYLDQIPRVQRYAQTERALGGLYVAEPCLSFRQAWQRVWALQQTLQQHDAVRRFVQQYIDNVLIANKTEEVEQKTSDLQSNTATAQMTCCVSLLNSLNAEETYLVEQLEQARRHLLAQDTYWF
ncbi:MAG: CYTH domain-containing protein [Plesiomonas sp.]|uniref:CYTH and CHAD domain-containing protein n=1 Tax=Plesiomonas sp. TaxID=2486279 RepID=UPI003F377180